MTDSGPLDILAVDSEGTLVVVELKNEASEGHLDQALRYYDWSGRRVIARRHFEEVVPCALGTQ